MTFYVKAQSQHIHSMLYLAVELARMQLFFGDAPYAPDGSIFCTVVRSQARECPNQPAPWPSLLDPPRALFSLVLLVSAH